MSPDRREVLRAGELRHKLTYQAAEETPDGQGGVVKAWIDAFIVWAAVEYLGGDELIAAQQLAATARIRLRHYFRAEVRADMQIVWVNRGISHLLQVEAYEPLDPGNVGMAVTCSEIQL
jgi:SPP1 family predicted phage head-tail adaptor